MKRETRRHCLLKAYRAQSIRLKKYRQEDAKGILVHIPVPIGTTVWMVRENPACHYGVRKAEKFLFGKVVTPRWIAEPVPFSLGLLDKWNITVFGSDREANAVAEKKGATQDEG